MMRVRPVWGVVAIGTLTLGAIAGGCNYIGAAYVLAHGPAKAPAAFELPKDRSVVVFVDDRGNMMGRRSLRQVLAESVTNSLMQKGEFTNVISSKAALDAASGESASAPLDIVTLGKNARADLVIYVTMDEFVLTRDGQTITPYASMRVKVLDVTKPDPRLFPKDAAGHKASTSLQLTPSQLPPGVAGRAAAEETLAAKAGNVVAELFYEHEIGNQPSSAQK